METFPQFEETSNAYWWLLCLDKFYAARETSEAQRFQEMEKGLSGQPLKWCQRWKQYNPRASLGTFELAFLHRFSEDSEILPPVDPHVIAESEWEEEVTVKNGDEEQCRNKSQRQKQQSNEETEIPKNVPVSMFEEMKINKRVNRLKLQTQVIWRLEPRKQHRQSKATLRASERKKRKNWSVPRPKRYTQSQHPQGLSPGKTGMHRKLRKKGKLERRRLREERVRNRKSRWKFWGQLWPSETKRVRPGKSVKKKKRRRGPRKKKVKRGRKEGESRVGLGSDRVAVCGAVNGPSSNLWPNSNAAGGPTNGPGFGNKFGPLPPPLSKTNSETTLILVVTVLSLFSFFLGNFFKKEKRLQQTRPNFFCSPDPSSYGDNSFSTLIVTDDNFSLIFFLLPLHCSSAALKDTHLWLILDRNRGVCPVNNFTNNRFPKSPRSSLLSRARVASASAIFVDVWGCSIRLSLSSTVSLFSTLSLRNPSVSIVSLLIGSDNHDALIIHHVASTINLEAERELLVLSLELKIGVTSFIVDNLVGDSGVYEEDSSVYNCTYEDSEGPSITHYGFGGLKFDISLIYYRGEDAVGFQPLDLVCLVYGERGREDVLEGLMPQKPLKFSKFSVGVERKGKTEISSNSLPLTRLTEMNRVWRWVLTKKPTWDSTSTLTVTSGIVVCLISIEFMNDSKVMPVTIFCNLDVELTRIQHDFKICSLEELLVSYLEEKNIHSLVLVVLFSWSAKVHKGHWSYFFRSWWLLPFFKEGRAGLISMVANDFFPPTPGKLGLYDECSNALIKRQGCVTVLLVSGRKGKKLGTERGINCTGKLSAKLPIRKKIESSENDAEMAQFEDGNSEGDNSLGYLHLATFSYFPSKFFTKGIVDKNAVKEFIDVYFLWLGSPIEEATWEAEVSVHGFEMLMLLAVLIPGNTAIRGNELNHWLTPVAARIEGVKIKEGQIGSIDSLEDKTYFERVALIRSTLLMNCEHELVRKKKVVNW